MVLNPLSFNHASIAQLVEWAPLKCSVGGSSPSGSTMKIDKLIAETLKEVESVHQGSMRDQNYFPTNPELTASEQALLNLWRQVCLDSEKLDQEFLKINFLNFPQLQRYNALRDQNSKYWKLLFDQLESLGILDKIRTN